MSDSNVDNAMRSMAMQLSAEYRADCVGLGDPTPRISWTYGQSAPGWRQSAYQLTLRRADGKEERAPRVDSSESSFVSWPFDPLSSRERVVLTARAWGADASEINSEPLIIEAGLLHSRDWQAVFITPSWDLDETIDAPAALFRREFEVKAGLRKARLYSTALGTYEAKLNAAAVSDEVLAPGWTSYKHRLRYQTSDVTALLRSGPNTLAASVADGWFHGRIGFMGGQRHRYGDRLAFLAQLELEYEDGTVQRICTDPSSSWQCGTGGISASSIYDGETFDARLEQPGWELPGFRAIWSGVKTVDVDLKILVAPEGPPVRRIQVVEPVAITRSPSGKLIVDFGQNVVGWTRITVTGKRGRVVTLRHAEVLEGGELCIAPLREARATDQYTLRGGEAETWEPKFTFHGFRFVQVDGWPGELQPSDIQAVVVHSDLARRGWFECSNSDINRLHENIVWSMRGNFLDIPTDCPQRDERLGWTGDIQVFAPTACYLYDVSGFLSSWLKDVAVEQADSGLMPMVVPDTVPVRIQAAGWGDAATIVPWTLYKRTGDLGVLARQYKSMSGWVELVLERVSPDGLWNAGPQLGDWLDPTAPPEQASMGRTAPHVAASAYLVHSLRIMVETAKLLGRAEDEKRYAAALERTRSAFRRRYVTPGGWIISDSPAAYALAICFDLLDEGEREAAGQRLHQLVAADDYKIGTGFLGTPLVCDALASTGNLDTAYRLLLQTEAPSWLYAVRMGATTVWERWDSLQPDGKVNTAGMTSFNHYAFGAIADWLHRCVAGLDLADVGYSRLRIQPKPGGDISWARARHITPNGAAEVHWELSGGSFKLTATVPANTTAEVHLPGSTPFVVEAGQHQWTVDMAAPATRRPWSVDSKLADVRAQEDLWTRLAAALAGIDPVIVAMMQTPMMTAIRVQSVRDALTLSPHFTALVRAAGEVFSHA